MDSHDWTPEGSTIEYLNCSMSSFKQFLDSYCLNIILWYFTGGFGELNIPVIVVRTALVNLITRELWHMIVLFNPLSFLWKLEFRLLSFRMQCSSHCYGSSLAWLSFAARSTVNKLILICLLVFHWQFGDLMRAYRSYDAIILAQPARQQRNHQNLLSLSIAARNN